MSVVTATKARTMLYQLVDEVAETHKPVLITGKRANAVLVSEEDWESIQATLHLLSVPGMRESIVEGMAEPLEDSSTDLDW